MNTRKTELGVLVVSRRAFEDERGFFFETWNDSAMRKLAFPASSSKMISRFKAPRNRRLHFQHPNPHGKLVSALHGAIFDVAVDLRVRSPTFGQWFQKCSARRIVGRCGSLQGFAHGFQALRDNTVVLYKCDGYYSAADEFSVRWDDPALAIDWPLSDAVVSAKDAAAMNLKEVGRELFLASGRAPESP